MLILKPYSRQPKDKPIGYVLDHSTIVGEWEGSEWRHVPPRAVLYCNDARDMRPLYERGECEAIYWKRAKRVRHLSGWKWYHQDGHPHMVYFLRNCLNAIPLPDRFSAILEFVDVIRGYGATPASPVGMLNSLLRVSLRSSFVESCDDVPIDDVWRGSRVQQSRRMQAEFSGVDLWDIRAAFPTALASVPIPRRWKEYAIGPRGKLPLAESGYARAIVHVPEHFVTERGPLRDPASHQPSFPTDTVLKGVWAFTELRAAEDAGCGVFPLQAWTGHSFRTPFAEWGRLVNEIRDNVGINTVPLVKQAANRYVGKVAMDGHRERSFMVDGVEHWIVERGHKKPDSLTVHGLVTSAVRAQLFTEGINPYPGHFIFCHTDGVALVADSTIDKRHPPNATWRMKAFMEQLLLINPSRYAYRPGAEDLGPGDWRYVVAGIPQQVAEPFFDHRWLRVDHRRTADTVLNHERGKRAKRRGTDETPNGLDRERRAWRTARYAAEPD